MPVESRPDEAGMNPASIEEPEHFLGSSLQIGHHHRSPTAGQGSVERLAWSPRLDFIRTEP